MKEATGTGPERLGVDPRQAHQITMTSLATLVPHANRQHIDVIRREFALWLTSANGRKPYADWREAWNAWTGATERQHGRIEYRTPRCDDCSHGVSHRNIGRNVARTGNPHICATCGGTGRGQLHRETAAFARP